MSAPETVPVTDHLRGCGAHNVKKDDLPEAKETVLRNVFSGRNGVDPLRLQMERDTLASMDGFTAGQVDAAIRACGLASKRQEVDAGTEVIIEDVEAWQTSVVLNELLLEIMAIIQRFVLLPLHASVAVSLYVVFTYVVDVMEHCPMVVAKSGVKRSGKTRLLSVMKKMVRRPLSNANASTSAIFRAAHEFRTTLLLDEVDRWAQDPERMGILNGGFDCDSAYVLKTNPNTLKLEQFYMFVPKILAMIGDALADTVEDRSIMIHMVRQTPDERRERFRSRGNNLEVIRRQCQRWADDNIDALADADPDMPAELHDRAQDKWRGLIAIADMAGNDWPEWGRKAALALSDIDDDADVLNLRALDDVVGLLVVDAPAVHLADAASRLCLIDGRGWARYDYGRGLDSGGLAKLLKSLGIEYKRFRIGEKNANGYRADWLLPVVKAYLPHLEEHLTRIVESQGDLL